MKKQVSKRRRPIHAASATAEAVIGMLCEVEILAANGEAKKLPTFTGTAYTGGPLRVAGYQLPIIIDLTGLVNADAIHGNLDHNPKKRVGHVEKTTNDLRKLDFEGVISATGRSAKEVVTSAANKYPWKLSVEAVPTEKPQLIAAGQKVVVNGQSFQGPVLVARKSLLRGFAFLSRGADPNTSVSIAAAAAGTQTKELTVELEQWIEAMGLDPATLTDKVKAKLQEKYEAEIKAAAKKPGAVVETLEIDVPAFDADDIKAAASDHLASLEAIFAEHEDEVKPAKFAEIRAAASKKAKELKVKALKEKWPGVRYEAELIRAGALVELDLVRAERPAGPAIHSSGRADLTNPVIEAALCQSVGLAGIEKHFDDQTLQSAHSLFRGRMGLQQAIIMAAEANGYARRDYRIDQGNLREMLRYAFAPIHAAGGSTVSLPITFSNLANKELLLGYMLGPQYDVWRKISRVKTVTDFKAVTSFRLLDNMEYEELGPNGEIKSGTVSEQSYTRQANTYAKMFTLTRTNIINDDLGAFDDIRTRLGAGSSRKFTRIFWTTFLNNSAFFTSARGNLVASGGTSALGVDGTGLNEAVITFKEMETPDGKRAGGTPTILMTPPELSVVAQQLFTATVPRNPSDVNPYAGKYQPLEVDWLSDSSIAGYSATAWYLLQDPAILASIVVSFLNGNQAPFVESADADFDTLGVQFRGYHDFGVDYAEYLAGVKSPGA